jgi:hypothetical protein
MSVTKMEEDCVRLALYNVAPPPPPHMLNCQKIFLDCLVRYLFSLP